MFSQVDDSNTERTDIEPSNPFFENSAIFRKGADGGSEDLSQPGNPIPPAAIAALLSGVIGLFIRMRRR
jgi:hypothetical protein